MLRSEKTLEKQTIVFSRSFQQRAGISLKVRRTLGMRDLSFKNINIVKSPFKRAGVRNAGPTFRLSAFSKMTFRLSDFQQIKKSFSKMTFRLSDFQQSTFRVSAK